MPPVPPWQNEAHELLEAIRCEVDQILQSSKCQVLSAPSNLVGMHIDFRISHRTEANLKDLETVARSRLSVSATTVKDDALFIAVRFASWATTRVDRLAGSRVMSMEDDEPLSSPKWKQVVRLSGDDIPHHPFTRGYQEMCWVLGASARLSVSNITASMRQIRRQVKWWDWPDIGLSLPWNCWCAG